VQWRSGYVIAGGGLLVVLLGALIASVVWVSDSSKHPLLQPNPAPSTGAPTPSPTVAAGPLPLPVRTTEQPPAAPPTEAWSPSQLTAETKAPEPPRHRRLHELFPHLFQNR
jgi:hypothetical protein